MSLSLKFTDLGEHQQLFDDTFNLGSAKMASIVASFIPSASALNFLQTKYPNDFRTILCMIALINHKVDNIIEFNAWPNDPIMADLKEMQNEGNRFVNYIDNCYTSNRNPSRSNAFKLVSITFKGIGDGTIRGKNAPNDFTTSNEMLMMQIYETIVEFYCDPRYSETWKDEFMRALPKTGFHHYELTSLKKIARSINALISIVKGQSRKYGTDVVKILDFTNCHQLEVGNNLYRQKIVGWLSAET